VVCDKATFPRDKTCGDGLTTAALRSLERLGLPRSALASSWSEVTETVVVSPSGRQVVLPLPRAGTYAAVVPRVALDTALVDLARERGVDVRERAPVTDVVTDASGAKVRVADGTTFEARFVVAADGHWSTVRRQVAPAAKPVLGEWHAARQYFSGVHDDRLWILFEPDLLPGYAWI